MKRTTAAFGAGLTATALVLAGCSSSDSGSDEGSDNGGKPSVVTSTDVWGSVARTVAGDKADVTELFNDPTGDPHDFEPSAADTAKVTDANVILMNGGDYDEYLEKAAKNSKGSVVNAFDLLSDEQKADKAGHGEVNEHVFYNLEVVAATANKLADTLADKDSADADTFHSNAKKFTTQIDELRHTVGDLKASAHGAKVIQTEPLAAYLLTEAGLVDATPPAFEDAVEEDRSPSAADRAKVSDLVKTREAKALLYNVQAVDPATEALLKETQAADVPVVKLTETLPQGTTDYVAWQRGQIDALKQALSANTR